jgi:hypothetical protein
MEVPYHLHDRSSYFLLYWFGIALILLIADYYSGPFVQFPITYLVPIALASWYNGRSWGLAFATALPLVRLCYNIFLWQVPWTFIESSVNCLIRIVVFTSFVILLDRIARQNRQLTREVILMTGLLPICSHCKKIRDDKDQWQPIEQYITRRSDASFTHGVCPECAEKYYGLHIKEKTE